MVDLSTSFDSEASALLLSSNANEAQREEFSQGSCHILAVALHRHLDWPIVIALDYDEPFWQSDTDPDDFIPAVIHAYALDEDGLAWDILGARHEDSVSKQLNDLFDIGQLEIDILHREEALSMYVGYWGDDDDHLIERPLWDYDDQDIDRAWQLACDIFGHLPRFEQALQRKEASAPGLKLTSSP